MGYDAYEVKGKCSVADDFLGNPFRVEFTAGKHIPKNEIEEYALERLVATGSATRVKSTKAKE